MSNAKINCNKISRTNSLKYHVLEIIILSDYILLIK